MMRATPDLSEGPDSTIDSIAQTDFDYLYQSARVGLSSYLIDLANGRYLVRLHFAEIEFAARTGALFQNNGLGTTAADYDNDGDLHRKPVRQ